MSVVEPHILLIGTPLWVNEVANLLRELDFVPVPHEDRAGYIQRLVKEIAALVIVDSNIPDWTSWIVSLKVEQATICSFPHKSRHLAALRND